MKTRFGVFLCVLSLIVTVAVDANNNPPIGTITMSVGDVFVKHEAVKQWDPVNIGGFLYEGDRLKTKETGKAEVLFLDGSVVFIGNETEIEFMKEKGRQKKKKNAMFLFFGTMMNKVTKGSAYEVESIHALATVKGTEFGVTVSELMEIWVREGVVKVENEQGSILALHNTYTRIIKDSAPEQTPMNVEDMPEVVSEPEYQFELSYPQVMHQNQPYLITGIIGSNKKASRKPEETFSVTVSASSDFLIGENRDASQKEIDLEVQNNRFEIYVVPQEESGSISFKSTAAPDILSQTIYIKAKEELKEKKVYIEFNNEEGNTRKINASFIRND
ncbi:hypothetical protein DID78_05845 [Candidatus Marinamargulisbacteria bacterium SCGC AG-343-D04]|nr:hypothetical protein DID78_05845 [Candidatus Marinamargulisbacteria bacterium SCGC AG-343-D04]